MIYKEPLIKSILLKLKYGPKANCKSYTKYLRKKGIQIGQNVEFNSPWTIDIDYIKPWLISIGDNVIISSHVSIISHGADRRILQNKYGDVMASSDQIEIGNNVFIGTRSIVLKNVKIGDNVIVGAGSVVTKDLESDSVYAGNPARYIMSLEDFYKKRLSLQDKEFQKSIKIYKEKYDKNPVLKDYEDYFFLFEKRKNEIKEYMNKHFNNGSSPKKSKERFMKTKNIYESFDTALIKVTKDE